MADEVKQYLVMTDICVLSDTKVIRGEALDEHDRSLWLPVANKVLIGGSFIRAGSVIEKPESLTRNEIKAGVYVNAGETRHFNLEAVFDKHVDFFTVEGKPGKDVILADVLKAHSVHTIESVIANSVGYKPLLDGVKGKGGNKINAWDILRLYAKDEDEVQAWLARARAVVGS